MLKQESKIVFDIARKRINQIDVMHIQEGYMIDLKGAELRESIYYKQNEDMYS